MTNSILLGKAIFKLLSESRELQEVKIDPKKIMPLIADNDISFPFITYSRDSIYPSSLTKDGIHEDTCTFSIFIVSQKYIESLEIANICRGIFEKRKLESEGLILEYVQLSSVTEEYQDNSYVQNLSFQCKVTDKI